MPKALVHDSKDGSPYVVVGHRGRTGVEYSQGGRFDLSILCNEHEALTSALDRYGVEFVRRAIALRNSHKASKVIEVSNPSPETLRRFALSVVWREVVSRDGVQRGKSLGAKHAEFKQAIFEAEPSRLAVFVVLPSFVAGGDEAVRFSLYPFKIRFMGLIAWQFTVVGCSFFICTDGRPTLSRLDWLRADLNDPAHIIVGDKQNLNEVGILKPILRDMLSPRR